MQFLDIGIRVGGLNDSQQPIFMEVNFFEANLLDWVVWVLDEGVTDENTALALQILVFGEAEFGDVNSTIPGQGFVQVKSALKIS